MNQVDVLCIGYACWDLNFQIQDNPGPDDKIFAEAVTSEGGGPAANAAYAIARLGGRTALVSQLGKDALGTAHLEELKAANVDTQCILHTDTPTSTSSILVNQLGQRSIVNYKPDRSPDYATFDQFKPNCLLMDGHEPEASHSALKSYQDIPSVLDAGSLTPSTSELSSKVTHLVSSTRFATAFAQSDRPEDWLSKLQESAANIAVTRGENGVVWRSADGEQGHIEALAVTAIDTTAAGDIFHGALAYALANDYTFYRALSWANHVAGISVTRQGGRRSAPLKSEVPALTTIR